MTPLTEALADLDSKISLQGLPGRDRCRFLVEIGEHRFGVNIEAEYLRIVTDVGINATWDFSFSITDEVWEAFCHMPPPRGHTTAQSLVATVSGAAAIRGNRIVWAQYAAVVDRVLDTLREQVAASQVKARPDPTERSGMSPISGRYITFAVGDTLHRIYFETAGQGQTVLCLHTAGADSRQYRHLLEDEELGKRYRFIAFDMPWHGRSPPPDDWQHTTYCLTTQMYTDVVLAFMSACELDRPILLGCSMAGAIALYLASTHGEMFLGVCSVEGQLGNQGRFVSWTNMLEVDHSLFLTSWVAGLMSPASPVGPRNQTLWGYAQSGPGVYQGDTNFGANDFPRYVDQLQRATCPLYVFSGEYDYSATTERSRQAAERLGGSLITMPGCGHFPMSEDPAAFREYLVPVLDQLTGH